MCSICRATIIIYLGKYKTEPNISQVVFQMENFTPKSESNSIPRTSTLLTKGGGEEEAGQNTYVSGVRTLVSKKVHVGTLLFWL